MEEEFYKLNKENVDQKDVLLLQAIKNRKKEYPPVEDFLDAWVKQDEVALQKYRQDCLDVKSKYPKP